MERHIQRLCLADTRTEVHAASQMNFYGSGIWVNILKRPYKSFPKNSAIVGPKFE